MDTISDDDKNKTLSFIKENDLDYIPIDNGIIRFHVMAYDGIKFFFYKNNDEYTIVKYDSTKDKPNNPSSIAYEYFNFKTISQVLEQLSFYDKSIPKNYWGIIGDTIECGVNQDTYNDEWHKDFVTDDFYKVQDSGSYKYITYVNNNYKPELKSPFNTLHEVSPINKEVYTKVEKLYFEIHPISCSDGQETYLFQLCCNNEEVLKEYINYLVNSKKGLKLLLNAIFKELERFKIS